jgi:hypothetical protein
MANTPITTPLDLLLADRNLSPTTGWQDRHDRAVNIPQGVERPLVVICRALEEYATMHQQRFESPVGEDGVLGDGWRDILQGLRTLLNGEAGALDCGTVDGYLCRLAERHGVDLDS